MAVNYDDERFQQVAQEQNQAIQNVQNTYNQMISQADEIYKQQAQAAEEYGRTQQELQQQQTDFAIQEINQQKEQAQQDYTKQQKAAYADYQDQINPYGANAEAMAQMGLRGSGYSETNIRSMYNQYQSRVASARDSFDKSVLNYNNLITQARLTNSSKLAEIAYNALQLSLEKNLAGFQYKNQLMLNQLSDLNTEKDRYYSRWKDVLSQINYENEQAENQRRYEEQMAEERRQFNEQMALSRANASGGGAYFSDGGGATLEGEAIPTNSNGQLASEPVRTIDGVKYIPNGNYWEDDNKKQYPIYVSNGTLYYWNGKNMISTKAKTATSGQVGGTSTQKTTTTTNKATTTNKTSTSNKTESTAILKRNLKVLPREYKVVGGKQYPVYQDKRNNDKYYLKDGKYVKIK